MKKKKHSISKSDWTSGLITQTPFHTRGAKRRRLPLSAFTRHNYPSKRTKPGIAASCGNRSDTCDRGAAPRPSVSALEWGGGREGAVTERQAKATTKKKKCEARRWRMRNLHSWSHCSACQFSISLRPSPSRPLSIVFGTHTLTLSFYLLIEGEGEGLMNFNGGRLVRVCDYGV